MTPTSEMWVAVGLVATALGVIAGAVASIFGAYFSYKSHLQGIINHQQGSETARGVDTAIRVLNGPTTAQLNQIVSLSQKVVENTGTPEDAKVRDAAVAVLDANREGKASIAPPALEK